MKRHLLFDMDDTVTPSRSPIGEEMEGILVALSQTHDMVVMSGQQKERIAFQLGERLASVVYMLCQNGNEAIAPGGELLWHQTLSDDAKRAIYEHIAKIEPYFADSKYPQATYIEDRAGSQISFSAVGHNAPLEIKRQFDPGGARRVSVLQKEPLVADMVEVHVAGTTTFDYFMKGVHKGFNLEKLMSLKGWQRDECIYFGDSLFPGGNDESMIGVCDTVAVTSPKDTLLHCKHILEKSQEN